MLRFKVTPENEGELGDNSFQKDEEHCAEIKKFVNELPNLFERNGRVKNLQVNIKLKKDAKITGESRLSYKIR